MRQGGHLFLLGLGRELEDSEHYFPEKEEERGRITRKAKLHSQLGSDLGRILLIGINQVGTEGAIGLAARIVALSSASLAAVAVALPCSAAVLLL